MPTEVMMFWPLLPGHETADVAGAPVEVEDGAIIAEDVGPGVTTAGLEEDVTVAAEGPDAFLAPHTLLLEFGAPRPFFNQHAPLGM
jgi:hypothetical protein